MGIIVRTPYVPAADITAEGQNANEDVMINEINGNLDNANIKGAAGILGTKIAAAPNGIPTDRINDSAVTSAKIADGAIIAAKIPAASILKGKLKLVEVTQAFSITGVTGLVKIVTVTPTTPAVLPTLAEMLPISLTVEDVNANTEAIAGLRKTSGNVTLYTLCVINTGGTSATGVIRMVYLDII